MSEAKMYFDDIEIHNIFYELVPLKISDFPKKTIPNSLSKKPATCICLLGYDDGDCAYAYQDENGGWHIVNGTCIDNVCIPPPGQTSCGIYWWTPCNGWRCQTNPQ
jgi:hypothetical protein